LRQFAGFGAGAAEVAGAGMIRVRDISGIAGIRKSAYRA
jgi:hypothetical protein